LKGDNIVSGSSHTDWYQGPSLLEYLENVTLNEEQNTGSRFQVQYVIRPQTEALHDYRGYAGQVLSGKFQKGDKIQVLPAGIISEIVKIEINGLKKKKLLKAACGFSCSR
jgi:sulfate adenylyltransferase subunit 1